MDHYHARWGVPSTDRNPARLADFEALPDWNNDVASGTLPHHRADDFARMVHPDLLPKMQTLHVKRIDPTIGGAKVRAFATAHVPLVDERDDHAVFWHEASHVVEGASRELGRRVKDFLLHRIEKSGDFGYKPTSNKHPDEKGYRDNFLDRYVGRWYYRDGLGDESADHASEVLSMGSTYMGENVRAFAQRDPEHLAFTLLALSGQLGLRDSDNDAQAEQKVKQRIQQGTYSLSGLRHWHKKQGG